MDPTDSTKNLSNNRFNDAVFDNVAVEHYFVEIEGIRYPKGPINNNHSENDYPNQVRDLNLFVREYVGGQVLTPKMTFEKMKPYYPIQVVDFGFQTDYLTPKKNRPFEKHDKNPTYTTFWVIIVKHTAVSDVNKNSGLNLFES